MKVAHTLSEGLKHEFKITIPSSDITAKVTETLRDLGKNAKIPGFRPGKAPEALLRQRYGARALQETVEDSIQTSIKQVFSEHKIRQAFQPKIDVNNLEEGKDLEFTVLVESLPEIKLKDFKSISLQQLNVEVGNEEIEKNLSDLAKRHKKFVPLKEPRPAQTGDFVTFEILDVTVDGNKETDFNKIGTIELGHERNAEFKELDHDLQKKNVGEELTVTQILSFDEENSEKDKKESKAVFEIKVSSIEEPSLFDVNDDLAKEFKLETIDDLRKNMKENIEVEYKKLSRLHVKRFLLDKLAEEYKFELPPTLVEGEFKSIWSKLQEELKEAKKNGALKEEEKSEEELQKEYRAIAERRVRLGLLISEISKVNKIQVTEEELRMVIFNQAVQFNRGQINQELIGQYFDYYRKNQQALDQLAAPLLEDKVIDFVISGVSLEERSIDSAAFKKAIRGVIPTPYDDEEEEEAEGSDKVKTESKSKAKKSKGNAA